MKRPSRYSAGFTLIEAIMTIVITGILAGIVAVFITKPVQGYADSVRRAELTDAADVALRRITRDVRLSLPNSLRVSGSCIEFIMTSTGGRYRDAADGSTGGDFFSFTSAADVTFDVLGKTTNVAGASDYIAANDFMVIYNLGPGNAPADAYQAIGAGGNRAQVNSVSCAAAPCTVTLAANPYPSQSPPVAASNANARFQVVPNATQAVTYACSGGQLKRYAAYGFNTAQSCPPGGGSTILAGSGNTTAACAIDYSANATGRNGLLYIQLTLTDTPSSEAVTLFQQIHVDNSP